jgi:hypothetical protein
MEWLTAGLREAEQARARFLKIQALNICIVRGRTPLPSDMSNEIRGCDASIAMYRKALGLIDA